MKSATSCDYFNPSRYWADKPDYFAFVDAVDAELDREDSLSDRNAFLLGRDMGVLRLDPLKDSDGVVNWRNQEMERGFAYGLGQTAVRSTVYQRKLLGLRVKAFLRNIPVSSAITVDYLRDISVGVCPVSGVKLTRGECSESDWSIDRLDNTLGYVPGNVCFISRRVNSLKGTLNFEAVSQEAQSILLRYGPDGFVESMSNGLLVLEGLRLAALMAAPSGFAEGKIVHYGPFAMAPGAWATMDTAIAGIHVECARTVSEGSAYIRRRALFKRLGKGTWRASNRLVQIARTEISQGTHPTDIWFEGGALAYLKELLGELLANPPEVKGIDPEVLVATFKTGLTPLQHYAR